MEFISDHDNLGAKKESTNSNSKTNSQYKGLSVTNSSLTPISNRKNSDYILHSEISEIQSQMDNSENKFMIIGICGGQSSGKSLITLYLTKHLKGALVVSEKDYFIGTSKERRKSFNEDKLQILNSSDDDYSVKRKHRLVETNSLRCFDWESLKNSLINLRKGNVTNFQSWDKEKNEM